ncbi:abortive infection system antitoxin AbiGi family protein [Vreelandella titanicae]|uniref:abortive infection system antitoxin AbiGi family protein n=1 Tax=Vreelandella titanicae TaxID=664683 RepID=UPI001145014B|nr:abortive infection system antitoxin AbiGi family protein [Halomonas titanicae]
MASRPGTVSKILWHFTGGPIWDDAANKQLKELKPAIDGYEALKAILKSQQLRVGKYHEVVKVIIPEKRRYDLLTRKFEILKNHPVTVKSQSVCCVADIPLQHIGYHSNRYGKIAIGFHRESIVKAGFNPVMYTLENTTLLNSIYRGYSAIDEVEPGSAQSELESLQGEIDNLIENNGLDDNIDISGVEMELDWIEQGHGEVEDSFQNFIAYIKTFDTTEFDSIYCEREWRNINNYSFTMDDIAIIILPKEQEGERFYERFLDEVKLPKTVSIACWEDLVEH